MKLQRGSVSVDRRLQRRRTNGLVRPSPALGALLADICPAADGLARGFDIGLFAVAGADSGQRGSEEDQPKAHPLSIG